MSPCGMKRWLICCPSCICHRTGIEWVSEWVSLSLSLSQNNAKQRTKNHFWETKPKNGMVTLPKTNERKIRRNHSYFHLHFFWCSLRMTFQVLKLSHYLGICFSLCCGVCVCVRNGKYNELNYMKMSAWIS